MPVYPCTSGCGNVVERPPPSECIDCDGSGKIYCDSCPIHAKRDDIPFGGPCKCALCDCSNVRILCYGCFCSRCKKDTMGDGNYYPQTQTACSECQCSQENCKNVSQAAFATSDSMFCTDHLQQHMQQLQKRRRERETKETSRLQPLLCMNTTFNDDGKIANCGKHAKFTTRYSCRMLGYMRCAGCVRRRLFRHPTYTYQDYVKAFNDLNDTAYGIRPDNVTRQPTYAPHWDNGVFGLNRPQ